MNADEIFAKYVLKPVPEPEPVDLRQTGRTTRALMSLPAGSVYVVPNGYTPAINRMATDLGLQGIHVMSLHNYLNNGYYHGRRAMNGERVVFDHTIYEFGLEYDQHDKVVRTNYNYRISEYEVIFDTEQFKHNI